MKLYIANCTRQLSILNYRIPEVPNPVSSPVEVGRQFSASGTRELNSPQIDSIIAQLTIYGMRSVKDEIRDEMIPYIYSIDEPVRPEEIRRVMEHNSGQLTQRGRRLREDAALATKANMDKLASADEIAQPPSTLELSVQQEKPIGDEPQMSEGVRIRQDDAPGDKAPRGNKRR